MRHSVTGGMHGILQLMVLFSFCRFAAVTCVLNSRAGTTLYACVSRIGGLTRPTQPAYAEDRRRRVGLNFE
jgi:hypothetical protein